MVRMVLHKLESVEQYLKYLQKTPAASNKKVTAPIWCC
jgi:predicted choloylglycine hydrolase